MSISTGSDSISTPSGAGSVVEIEGTFYVLIPSRFPPIEIFQRIANDRDEDVAHIESLTNPRLRERERLLSGVAVVDVDSPLLQNWNHAPFTYRNPEGSRFFGSDAPVLELAHDLQTALAISVQKREQFLGRTKEAAIGLDMRVLSRRVQGRFLDCRTLPQDTAPKDLFAIGGRAIELGVDGILFRPSQRPAGECVAVLNNTTLDRAVQGEHFRFAWNGVRIASLYSFSSGKVIEPTALQQEVCVLAA